MKVDRQTIAIIIGITIGTICISFGANKLLQHKNSKVEEYVYMSQEVNTPLTEEVEETKKIKKVEEIVFDGLTLTELSDKLNRSLNSTLTGQGYFIASYSLEKGVDPYLATAIILHETGCSATCSSLVMYCNNVGGMKGNPHCGNGSYRAFNTLDEGIRAFIDNLANNYYAYGLTTPELMNSKYAESKTWAEKVTTHMNLIKSR